MGGVAVSLRFISSIIKLFLLQLSIIIVNYNVKYFLEQCIISVIAACKNIRAEIIVVDNHSTDGSELFFSNRFKDVQFIWLQQTCDLIGTPEKRDLMQLLCLIIPEWDLLKQAIVLRMPYRI